MRAALTARQLQQGVKINTFSCTQFATAAAASAVAPCIPHDRASHRLTSSTLKMAAARAIWPATYVANSAFWVLSITEPGTAIETVHWRPDGGATPLLQRRANVLARL